MSATTGWWAAAYNFGPDGHPFAPTLQWAGGDARLEGVWFATEDDCLDFIHNEVLGKGEINEATS